MRLKAVFTAEAAFIFSFIIIFVVFVIQFNFKLHDRVLNDSCKIQGDLRNYQAESFYYDSESATVNIRAIVCSPVVKKDSFFDSSKTVRIIEKYYNEYRLSSEENPSWDNVNSVITSGKNAETVRKGGRAVKLIGDLVNES